MPYRFLLLCCVGVALLVAGCQRVNVEKTINLTAGAVEVSIIDAPRSQQKVKVSITSADPIDVDVVLEANKAAVMETLLSGKRPAADKVLASKEKVKSDALSATIPAGKEYAILFSGAAKTTEVKVNVKSE